MQRDYTTSSFISLTVGGTSTAQQRFKQCLNGDVTQIPARTITRPLSLSDVPACQTPVNPLQVGRDVMKRSGVCEHELLAGNYYVYSILATRLVWLLFQVHPRHGISTPWLVEKFSSAYYTVVHPNVKWYFYHLLNQVGGNTHSPKSESRCRCEASTLLVSEETPRKKKQKKYRNQNEIGTLDPSPSTWTVNVDNDNRLELHSVNSLTGEKDKVKMGPIKKIKIKHA